MAWNIISDKEQVQKIIESSSEKPQVFFKHSTRCSISSMALRRFEGTDILNSPKVDCWYLDLLSYRSISEEIANQTKVIHQSPQAILFVNGQMCYAESHGMIDAEQILQIIA